LNEIFENIIDSCIKFDKNKFFVSEVKKKDAPNYYDVIMNPIDLGKMKNKAKRQEYINREQLMADMQLLRVNAETYNGQFNKIAELAREIEQHAINKMDEVKDDVANYELLVREKIDQGLLKI